MLQVEPPAADSIGEDVRSESSYTEGKTLHGLDFLDKLTRGRVVAGGARGARSRRSGGVGAGGAQGALGGACGSLARSSVSSGKSQKH